jgi:hypothetical protein
MKLAAVAGTAVDLFGLVGTFVDCCLYSSSIWWVNYGCCYCHYCYC